MNLENVLLNILLLLQNSSGSTIPNSPPLLFPGPSLHSNLITPLSPLHLLYVIGIPFLIVQRNVFSFLLTCKKKVQYRSVSHLCKTRVIITLPSFFLVKVPTVLRKFTNEVYVSNKTITQ